MHWDASSWDLRPFRHFVSHPNFRFWSGMTRRRFRFKRPAALGPGRVKTLDLPADLIPPPMVGRFAAVPSAKRFIPPFPQTAGP